MRIQENELVMLFLGIGVLLYVFKYRKSIQKIPSHQMLTSAYYCFLGAAASTVLEELFLHTLFDYLEHIFYLGSSLFLAFWSIKTSGLLEKSP